jgi:hypothetical protein
MLSPPGMRRDILRSWLFGRVLGPIRWNFKYHHGIGDDFVGIRSGSADHECAWVANCPDDLDLQIGRHAAGMVCHADHYPVRSECPLHYGVRIAHSDHRDGFEAVEFVLELLPFPQSRNSARLIV